MPELRTDDGPRKLRAVWLGPKGATLPFEWTYVQWAVTLLMIPVGIVLIAGLIALAGLVAVGHAPWFAFWFGLIYGAPAAVYGAVRIMRGVTFDEPLRYKITTARDELGGRSRAAAEPPMNWRMPWPRLAELSPAAERLFESPDVVGGSGSAAEET
ncbi:hypothetical protein GCM10011575_35880 [Microlunatus endophyticus]|uniref:Uncharacterized protein n=1 Tax=Microlunatus endophyticus TaxID=1716077 RepID=A0A917W7J5_9ACTN|nr:hypothetical protein [Microlunatus endophyticus]GGL74483.1 hypothetical protein GCM10011575_35880 [Microlunatus endophyticus]